MSVETDSESAPLETLEQRIEACPRPERPALYKRLKGIRRRARDGKPYDRALDRLAADIERAAQRRQAREQGRPEPEFPAELPVVEQRDAIADAIRDHQVVVVCGETGSGKSTQLPKICMAMGRGVDGLIGHTQPRRLAARTLAERVGEELATAVGEGVGYKVRFTDRVSDGTWIKFVTDGMLLAEIQGDRDLTAYDTLIIDEAHERSLNIDFLLGYLRRLLPRRPDLKVIITSATIDPERFAKHFDDAPILHVSGRTYPVETRYRPLVAADEADRDRDQQTAIVEAVDELAREGPGDILVFLATEREIRETAEVLRKQHPPGTEVLPLFARLSAAEQQRVFQPHGGRRIVLATNVAETSVTVPGIRYVVDTGLVRLSRYSVRNKVQRLPVEPISQASADQRAGRCGRIAPGVCIRLYSEDDYNKRPRYTDPEILRTNLAAVILRMQALDLGSVEAFPFVDPPDRRAINDGYRGLFELQAVDGERRLTRLGAQLARLPVDPTLARMLVAAGDQGALAELLIIAAALSVQDPRERPVEAQQAADQAHRQWQDQRSDFLGLVNLWRDYQEQRRHLSHNKLRRWCRERYLSPVRLREWGDIHRQLKELIAGQGYRLNTEPAELTSVHRCLLTGLVSNVAMRSDEGEYLGPRNLRLSLFPGSALAKRRPKWIVAADLVETSRVFARTVGAVDPRDIEQVAGHLVQRHYNEPHWDRRRGRVTAYETVTLYGLPLVTGRKVDFGQVDPETAYDVFLRQGLVEDQVASQGRFREHNRALIEEVQALEAKSRRRDVLVESDRIYAFYADRVPSDINDLQAFERWRRRVEKKHPRKLYMTREALMQHGAEEVTGNRYPERLRVADLELPLSYHFEPGHPDDGVTARVPLAALNQLRPEPLEWLVPGLLEDKVTALIRGLPKSLRRHFVPAPDFAAAVLDALAPGEGSLVDNLRRELHRMTGVDVPPETWDGVSVPEHLVMNLHVFDADGALVARGRDLVELQQRLGDRASSDFRTGRDDAGWERAGITRWDFGDLPETVTFRQHGLDVHGYPAIVDEGASVALHVMDSPEAAATATRAGVRRLIRLHLRDAATALRDGLPERQDMLLKYRGLGSGTEFEDELVGAVVERVFLRDHPVPRSQEGFRALLDHGRANFVDEGERFARRVSRVLDRHHELRKALKEPRGLAGMESFRDMSEHLGALVFPHFLLELPPAILDELPRYLDGLAHRLEKQAQDPDRDSQRTRLVRPWWDAWRERAERHREMGIQDPELDTMRQLIEEYRVSLFAQHLGTRMPASEKRLKRQWQAVR